MLQCETQEKGVSLDELTKLEEKIDKLIAFIDELKQKIEDYEEQNARLQTRDSDVKMKIEGIIERIDKLLV
jgi:FtsZ-binding cell division protein ZapB